MIDINLLRTEETFQKVLASEKKRFRDGSFAIEARDLDKEFIKKQYNLEQLKKGLNEINKKIKEIHKERKLKKEFDLNEIELQILITEKNECSKKIEAQNEDVLKTGEEVSKKLRLIGNILDDAVIFSKDENDNEILRTHENPQKIDCKILTHNLIMERLGGIEFLRGSKIVGHRGYFLKDDIALLEVALSRYAIDFAKKEEASSTYIQTPAFMKKEIMEKTCQLSDFDEQLYSVNDSHYLVATSEQPISALYMDERLERAELPKYFIGDSLCFRKEAGAHGKDNLGIFRIHQFHKLEQFVICEAEESKKYHERMIALTEKFLASLGFSTRTISIVSGEMNDAAAIKYDIEAYFPGQDCYRELASISNCLDYQSRDLNIRFGASKVDNKKIYVHMLNGTLCAIQRTMCGLLEIHQASKGVKVPLVLQKYMGKEFLDYVKN